MTPRRILLTRLRQIGDAILALPVADALRGAFPDAVIDFLAEPGPSQAAVGHPAIDRVLVWKRTLVPLLPAPLGLLAALRARRYDCVIDLYGNPRTALLAAWTGARIRIGPARSTRRFLYTHRLPPVREPLSAIDHHLRALEPLGIRARPLTPRIYLSERELEEGKARLDRALPPGAPRVGIHPGNRWPAKRWPEERFWALLRELPRIGATGIVLAGPKEGPLARRIAHSAMGGTTDAPVIDGLPLREYWAVLAALDALVTVDGSPLHAGPALGVPTVGILGPTVPEIWFPYSQQDGHHVLCREIWCRPCHRHECFRMDCLDWIGVEDALRATDLALAHSGHSRGPVLRRLRGTID